jgi:hypothetical protein
MNGTILPMVTAVLDRLGACLACLDLVAALPPEASIAAALRRE